MNKKGIIFTITTFILLWSLFLLSISYMSRNTGLQQLIIRSSVGDKIKYVEDDITYNIYYDLIKFNASSSRDQENITLKFNGPTLSNKLDHFSVFQDYSDYIEGDYSDLNNIDVQLTNLTPILNIIPFQTQLIINSTKMSITSQQLINTIEIIILVNATHAMLETNTTPGDSGTTRVNVQILDSNNKKLLSDEEALLNPTIANPSFYVKFTDNSTLDVKYGYIHDMDGSLEITSTNLVANVSSLLLVYSTTPEKVKIVSGELRINISPDFTKQSQILMLTE